MLAEVEPEAEEENASNTAACDAIAFCRSSAARTRSTSAAVRMVSALDEDMLRESENAVERRVASLLGTGRIRRGQFSDFSTATSKPAGRMARLIHHTTTHTASYELYNAKS